LKDELITPGKESNLSSSKKDDEEIVSMAFEAEAEDPQHDPLRATAAWA